MIDDKYRPWVRGSFDKDFELLATPISEYIMKRTSNGWGSYVGELIRCKDCKWWDSKENECIEWYDSPYAPADGFCFRAERKKNEKR